VLVVNEKAAALVGTVMEMIDGTLTNMEQDQFHAPAAWLLENWWHALNAALACSEIGNHADSKLNSLKPTDEAESKKRD
jgi:hypothetical protein